MPARVLWEDTTQECRCTPGNERSLAKVSGPLLDCIDLQIEVPAIPYGVGSKTDYQTFRL